MLSHGPKQGWSTWWKGGPAQGAQVHATYGSSLQRRGILESLASTEQVCKQRITYRQLYNAAEVWFLGYLGREPRSSVDTLAVPSKQPGDLPCDKMQKKDSCWWHREEEEKSSQGTSFNSREGLLEKDCVWSTDRSLKCVLEFPH